MCSSDLSVIPYTRLTLISIAGIEIVANVRPTRGPPAEAAEAVGTSAARTTMSATMLRCRLRESRVPLTTAIVARKSAPLREYSLGNGVGLLNARGDTDTPVTGAGKVDVRQFVGEVSFDMGDALEVSGAVLRETVEIGRAHV